MEHIRVKRLGWLVLLVGLAAMLAGCGGGQKITVLMTDFAFAPGNISFKAGQEVQLTFKNNGTVEHEVLIGREAGEGYAQDLFDRDASQVKVVGGEEYTVGSAEDIQAEGYHVEVEPGGSVTLAFTVPVEKAGEWEMGCFMDAGSHYGLGMHGIVTIEK